MKTNPNALMIPIQKREPKTFLSISEWQKKIANEAKKKISFLPSKTNYFFEFFRNQINVVDSSFTVMIMAQKRNGKTALAMAIMHELMKDKRRVVVLYKAPKALFDELIKVWPNRVVFATNILECDVLNGIVFVDEGVMGFNAKRALEAEMREFGEGLCITSHKRIILLINGQDDGVLRDLRKKVEILIYKRLGYWFCYKESGDPLVTEYQDLLYNLPKNKAIVLSNFDEFQVKCMINISLKKRVPFWTQAISTNMKGVSLSQTHQRRVDSAQLIMTLANDFVREIGSDIIRKSKLSLKKYLNYYFRRKDPTLELFSKIKPILNEIEIWAYGLATDADLGIDQTSKLMKADPLLLDKWTFADFLKANISDPKSAQILYNYNLGISLEEVAQNVGRSKPIVHDVVSKFKKNKKMGYWFEKYWRMISGDLTKVNTNQHAPDFIDVEGFYFYPNHAHSLKYSSIIAGTEKYSQKDDFLPELKYAKENGQDWYYVIRFDPKWSKGGSLIHAKKVYVKDPDEVVFIESDFKIDDDELEAGNMQIVKDFDERDILLELEQIKGTSEDEMEEYFKLRDELNYLTEKLNGIKDDPNLENKEEMDETFAKILKVENKLRTLGYLD